MSVSELPEAVQTFSVAFIGNPNTGKSTLFNALCGVHQRTGNYPGVTVEKKTGRFSVGTSQVTAIDLPGTYSLAARSPDEMIAVDVLLGRTADVAAPDVVLCIVDASNLERHLYLVSQVLELGLPIVLAMNMIDLAREKGIQIEVDELQRRLGLPVVPLQANRKQGLDHLKRALARVVGNPVAERSSPFPSIFCDEVDQLAGRVAATNGKRVPRFLVERALLDVSGYLDSLPFLRDNAEVREARNAARQRLAEAGVPVPAVEAMARYQWVEQTLAGVITRRLSTHRTWGDVVDRIVTHRFYGMVVFVAVMMLLFQSVFLVAEPGSALIDGMNAKLAQWVSDVVPAGDLQSLLVDGVIAGVGGVLVFLPQIFTLFFFIAVLEDCGYMARAAYLTDRLMAPFGLSGKSFIPLLSSFACAIPGIMAARVIESRRDRLLTILVAPLMTCSARLPVYALLISAFIPAEYRYLGGLLTLQGLVMLGLYLLGIITAIVVALILKKTLLPGAPPPFVMELPSYKWPSGRTVSFRMVDRGWAFVRRAGTMILAVTILVWAASYYPRNAESLPQSLQSERVALEAMAGGVDGDGGDSDLGVAVRAEYGERLAEYEHQRDAYYLEQSYLGRLGHWLEPVVRPLGWDWRLGCAAIASFPAREVVVATLGVIYRVGADADETTLAEPLRQATHHGTDRPVFTIPVALSVMVFFALCAQCASTLVTIRRETNSWRWPLFTFSYMTLLAYVGALLTYQVGTLLADMFTG
jgi:ferrous iron transport protein B